jgi:anaerobic selenocysteine-containing dehydrogenase
LKENGGATSVPISFEESLSVLTKAIGSSRQGSVAVLDGQPKRAISFAYRKFLSALTKSVYIVPPTNGGIMMGTVGKTSSDKNDTFGLDLENTRTILSFGAPVLECWGTLGQLSTIVEKRTREDGLKVIQVGPIHSRTARLADDWIPVSPGTEAAFALGIANVMVGERLYDAQKLRSRSSDFENTSGHSFTDLLRKFPPSVVSGQTGIPESKIIDTAREVALRKPTLVASDNSAFSRDEQIIFMDLNTLLDAVGTTGGLIPRKELPNPIDGKLTDETQLADVPDRSVKVLILDGAESGSVYPWRLIQKKLVPNDPLVVSFSPYFSGIARYADYLIPSPTHLESSSDSPSPAGTSVASYSISLPIITAPATAIEPLNVLKRIAAGVNTSFGTEIQSIEMLLRNRARRIFKEGKGIVFDALTGKATKLAKISSSAELFGILSNGGCWYDDNAASPARTESRSPHESSFLGGDKHGFEKLSAAAERQFEKPGLALLTCVTSDNQPHQLMTKLYRESDLREPGNEASINPETAQKFALIDGGAAVVKTGNGKSGVRVKFDKAIMPDAVQVAVGSVADDRMKSEENILEISEIREDSTWRVTEAEILPA